jgi:hypothetical protein
MPKATKCMVKINVKQALEIRDSGSVMLALKNNMFKCVECGKGVRPAVDKDGHHRAYFSHFRRNPKCSLSHELLKR